MRTMILACLVPVLVGCSTAGCRREVCCAPTPPTGPPAGVVFVANGSGDFRTVTANLSQAVAAQGVPLQIETLTWSHGYGRYILDHVDHCNHLEEGRRLAEQLVAYRQAYPSRKVYLIGHSAGCAVVLAATERLPPDSVERVILLAPSVCRDYDLRPSLRTTRCGIDAFYSNDDRVILGLGMKIVGTADGRCRTAAGQYGFTPVIVCPADAALYSKLRQHPWDPVVSWSGHDGGHYGSNQPCFLKAYVLPLLTTD